MESVVVLCKKVLEELYLNKKLSIRDVAKNLDVNPSVIRKWMNIYNIPRRNKSWKSASMKNGIEVPCEICGKMIYRKKSRLNKSKVFFCSWACEKEYQSLTRRILDLPDGWRRWKEYKRWRGRLIERDGVACKLCGSTYKIVAHHIIEAKTHPDLRYSVSNGIILCQACHIEIHKNNSFNYIESLQKVISVENPNIGETLEIDNPEASK